MHKRSYKDQPRQKARPRAYARYVISAILIAFALSTAFADEAGTPTKEAGIGLKSFHIIPGKTTDTEAEAAGYTVLSAAEFSERMGVTWSDSYTYIDAGDFTMRILRGIINNVTYYADKGHMPGKSLIGVSLDPDMSYREVIGALQENGYEVRGAEFPYPQFSVTDYTAGKLSQYASFHAFNPAYPDYTLGFVFYANDFWSVSAKGTLFRCDLESADSIDRFSTTMAKLPPAPQAGTDRQAALDLGVVLSVQNSEKYGDLMPSRALPKYKKPEAWKEIISDSWGINGREDYFRVFDDMVAEGHSKSYSDAMALLDEYPNETILKIAIANGLDSYHCDRLFFVAQTRDWLGERSLRAWDLGRMVNVTRWAYAAGYIDEDEAWERILSVAKTLRELYQSREDYIASYIGGRGFFGAGDPVTYMQDAYKAYMKESGKLDSRQQLPWVSLDRTDDSMPPLSRDAKIGDILYTVTDEQASARIVYKRLGDSIDGMNAAIRGGDGAAAINATEDALTILKGNRIGEYYPDLYYRIRFIRGYVFAVTGNYSLALDELHEFDSRFPGDKDAQSLIAKCEENLKD